MISKSNFREVLLSLEFEEFKPGMFRKSWPEIEIGCEMLACFPSADKPLGKLVYPNGTDINDGTTSNFKHNENFVVFECVARLLDKGYRPEHLELEPKWQKTRGNATGGGKADIWIRTVDKKGKKQSLCIIECKTAYDADSRSDEFELAWRVMCSSCDQLFSYGFEHRETKFLCLYTSDFVKDSVEPKYHLVSLVDNDEFLKTRKGKKILSYRDATDNESLFRAWKETYEQYSMSRGMFEPEIQPYEIGKKKYTWDDLDTLKDNTAIQKKYHEFATILRQHNVSGRENAFDKLVNLFLAKVVDETNNPNELLFYWKGASYDDDFRLQDRLQRLYAVGMDKFLGEKVTYINEETVEDAFKLFKKKPDETKDTIRGIIHELKFFSNNDFAFIDVHNEHLFYQNAVILRKIVMMLQDMKLRSPDQQHQFLGDLFEGFLDQGVKQSEGQFFTPMPYVKFMVTSLPIAWLVESMKEPPKMIDYACGAGHFMTEYSSQIRRFVDVKNVALPSKRKKSYADYFASVTGIEKEYRLSKVTKVAAFMYGQDEINVVYGDALSDLSRQGVKDGAYDVLIANPPYSVKGFFETLTEAERDHYRLSGDIDAKSAHKSNAIETFFIERAAQLLAPGGVAAIILPVSVLSKGGIYQSAREIMLESFDIVSIAEMGSGTFGKTGTNTATFFLRRKQAKPNYANHVRNRVEAWFNGDFTGDETFDDADVLKRYAECIGVTVGEYKTLLKGKPSDALLEREQFKRYFEELSNGKRAKKLKGDELKTYVLTRVVELEKYKLRVFMLAENNPIDVIVVKSPVKTKCIQEFLGYKWSGRRGSEGIKYLGDGVVSDDEQDKDEKEESQESRFDTNWIARNCGISRIQTPLFNPNNYDDASKINLLIKKNFLGKDVVIPDALTQFVEKIPLTSMIDFQQVEFDLALQTSGSPMMNVSYDNGKVPLSTVCDYVTERIAFGSTTLANYISTDNMLPSKGGVRKYTGNPIAGTVIHYKPNDILVSNIRPYLKKMWLSDCEGGCSPDVLVFRVKNGSDVDSYFLYQLLNDDDFFDFMMAGKKGSKMPRGNKTAIPKYPVFIPKAEIQKKVAKECKKIDEEYKRVRMSIDEYKAKINSIFSKLGAIRGGGG